MDCLLLCDLFVVFRRAAKNIRAVEQLQEHVDDLLEIVNESLDPCVAIILIKHWHCVRTSLFMNFGYTYPLIQHNTNISQIQ